MYQKSAFSCDALPGAIRIQSDEARKSFWQYLDKHPDAANIVRRWQKKGCDPRNIATAIIGYVIGYSSLLAAQRKERGRKTKKTLKEAVDSLYKLEDLHRFYGQAESADRIANEAQLAQMALSRMNVAFDTKRLGVSRSWSDLAMIEGFVFEATHERPTPKELVLLIKAGREAHGQEPDPWEANPVNIRKGLKTFKLNNPLSAPLWTNPSHMF